jgi:hypothetical protein
MLGLFRTTIKTKGHDPGTADARHDPAISVNVFPRGESMQEKKPRNYAEVSPAGKKSVINITK